MTKKKTPILIIVILIVILTLPSALAIEGSFIFQRNTDAVLSIPVFNYDNSRAENDVSCSVDLKSPSSAVVLDNEPLTFNQSGIFTFPLTSAHLQENGVYPGVVSCQNRVDHGFSTFSILVTPSGTEPSTGQGVMYSVLLFVLIGLFTFSTVVSFKLDDKNEFDLGGNLMKINYKKYLKLGLFFLSYLLLIFIVFVSWQISVNFLFLSFASAVLDSMHMILWILVIPIFIVVVVVSIIKFALDMKIQDLHKRGLKPYISDKKKWR